MTLAMFSGVELSKGLYLTSQRNLKKIVMFTSSKKRGMRDFKERLTAEREVAGSIPVAGPILSVLINEKWLKVLPLLARG